ncbi:hypothetical protein [Edwardsiella tarda]
MKKIIFFSVLIFSCSTFAEYKAYIPSKDIKYLNKAISGNCKKEHQIYDNLDFNLKENISNMNELEQKKAISVLKDAERKRWECIERELNKNNITLNLDKLFKMNNL